MSEYSSVEKPGIEVFEELGYTYLNGNTHIKDGLRKLDEVILEPYFLEALGKINPEVPHSVLKQVLSDLKYLDGGTFFAKNKEFHRILREGITKEFKNSKGELDAKQIILIDFNNKKNNNFIVSTQVVIKEQNRDSIRPDLVVYINGLPVGLFEFKDPENYDADVKKAYNQIKGYQKDYSQLFYYNVVNVISDGATAKAGSLTADYSRFTVWKSLRIKYPDGYDEQEILIRELFNKDMIIDILDNFVLFEDDAKIVATYYQVDAVNEAIERSKVCKDGRVGVIWHTQGAGKSFTMVFYARKVKKEDELNAPTILIVTDREDLDEQITNNFQDTGMKFSHRMQSIKDLKKHLTQSKQGGIFFTTIQKFQLSEKEKAEKKKFPMLNDRNNIIVLVDEAHRTQYNTMARNLARALPNAKRIGFTGTPIEINDERNTRTVFGEFISEYTIKQAEEDKVVVPIWYDPRKPKGLDLDIENLSKEVEKYVKDHTPEAQENFKRKWSKIDVILSDDKFIQKTADDIVKHFNERYLKGKAMLVTATREIAIKYKEYIDALPNAPKTDVAISGDEEEWIKKGYIKDKEQMKKLRKNFKNLNEEPQLLIVCDMLLTGYSASCLTTMYFLKPMKTHNLLQAIARVNRVYKDKPAGILVDYISIGDKIAEAVKIYSGKLENVMVNINQAVDLFQSKFRFIFNKYQIPKAEEFMNKSSLELRRIRNLVLKNITASDEDKKLFLKETLELKKLFGIISPREESLVVEEEVMYILGIRNEIIKKLATDKDVIEVDKALMRDLVSKHLEVGDIEHLLEYSSKKISVFSEDFVEVLRNIEGKNLQVEILRKILNDQIQIKLSKNVVKQQKFKDRLTKLMNDYKARYITVEDLIKYLVGMGKELDENPHRHVQLGLSEEELTFYDIFKEDGKKALEDNKIKNIVKDLVTYLSKATQRINWTNEDDFKRKIRAKVKDLLAEHGFKRSEVEPIIATIMKQTAKLYSTEV